MAFFRTGMPNGWVDDRAVSAGVGRVRPSSDALPEPFQREQWNVESFYRVHLKPDLVISPDLQYIKHPSLNPQVYSLRVAGLRARITS